jgi:hypothetical protein
LSESLGFHVSASVGVHSEEMWGTLLDDLADFFAVEPTHYAEFRRMVSEKQAEHFCTREPE